jgi:flagellar hook-associated protein 2
MATSSSSGIFTGSSSYSTDFQNVVTRAVAIASLPITLLTNDQTSLSKQSTELQTLDGKFAALQTAVGQISDALDGSSFQTSVSDNSVAATTVSTGATEGYYSIQVNDIGAYATSLSSASWNAASGSAHTYTLNVGGTKTDFTPADNSAASVAAAINAKFGSQVHATVVNVGSSSAPDYRLSLQGAKLADTPLDILDNGASLQTAQVTGRPAQYIVNGSGNVVQSDSRNVSIATGLTISLLSSSAGPVDITVTRSTSALADALSGFATAYNDATAELDAQRGQSAGPLQGQSIVSQLSQALSGLATYTSSNAIGNLSALGLTLGADGKLTFNSLGLMATDFSNSSGVAAFLGTSTGTGFLKAATDALAGIQDPVSGLLTTTKSNLDSEISNLTTTIAQRQAQVDDLQQRMLEQMAAADAMISSMEQQYSYMSNMFQAMQTADQQYK